MRNTSAYQRRREAEARRLKVLEIMGSGEVEPHILIANLALVCDWIETGKVPEKQSKPKGLKVVRP